VYIDNPNVSVYLRHSQERYELTRTRSVCPQDLADELLVANKGILVAAEGKVVIYLAEAAVVVSKDFALVFVHGNIIFFVGGE
jgi:hypothetical protein